MIESEECFTTWQEYLFGLFKHYRHSMGWEEIRSFLEADDRSYLDMLDNYAGR